MRFVTIAVIAVIGAAFAAVPAEAAKKRRSQVVQAPPTGDLRVGERGEAGVTVRRSRTRVIVTKRSYLDAGTEVAPGSMSSRNYVFPPNMRGPTDLYLPNEAAKSVLPHPWWLGSSQAPSWDIRVVVSGRAGSERVMTLRRIVITDEEWLALGRRRITAALP